MDDDIFQVAPPGINPPGDHYRMYKDKISRVQILDGIEDGIASETSNQTEFFPDGINQQETKRIAFTVDGQPTDPNYNLGRCYQNHLVSKANLLLCECGNPICPKDRILYQEKFVCKRCFLKQLAKRVLISFGNLLLAPFKE